MRLVFVVFALCIAFQAHARPELVGSWCHKYDDFTEVLLIQESMDVEFFTVGNSSGEAHGYNQGFLSIGASHQFLFLQGTEFVLDEIRVSGWFQKRLSLEYRDGGREEYVKCQTSRSPQK